MSDMKTDAIEACIEEWHKVPDPGRFCSDLALPEARAQLDALRARIAELETALFGAQRNLRCASGGMMAVADDSLSITARTQIAEQWISALGEAADMARGVLEDKR